MKNQKVQRSLAVSDTSQKTGSHIVGHGAENSRKMTFMYASAMTSISSGVLSQIRSCLDASTVGIVSTTETITVRMIAKAT